MHTHAARLRKMFKKICLIDAQKRWNLTDFVIWGVFTYLTINKKWDEVWTSFWSHFVTFSMPLPTMGHLHMFKKNSNFSKFGSHDRWRHNGSHDRPPQKDFLWKPSQINFRKSHRSPIRKKQIWWSSIKKTRGGGHICPPPLGGIGLSYKFTNWVWFEGIFVSRRCSIVHNIYGLNF